MIRIRVSPHRKRCSSDGRSPLRNRFGARDDVEGRATRKKRPRCGLPNGSRTPSSDAIKRGPSKRRLPTRPALLSSYPRTSRSGSDPSGDPSSRGCDPRAPIGSPWGQREKFVPGGLWGLLSALARTGGLRVRSTKSSGDNRSAKTAERFDRQEARRLRVRQEKASRCAPRQEGHRMRARPPPAARHRDPA